MSAVVDDADQEGTVVTVDWLERNASRVDIASAREQETESWTRGKSNAGDAEVDVREATGAAIVQLPDGDPHSTLLVEGEGGDNGPYAGACDCDGWQYHDGPCAHLIVRAVRSVLRSGEVPVDVARFQELDGERAVGDGGQSTDEALSVVGGLEDAPASRDERTSKETPAPAEATPVDDSAEVAMPNTAGDPFASELTENIPEQFVMDLGGEPYIRRAGYAAIARNANLRVTVEPVTAAEETDFTHARYKAVVRDIDGDIVGEDFGTAHVDGEDMDGAEFQLDELAATRSIRRALEWATGAGATLQRGGGR